MTQDPQQELFTAIKIALEKNENGYAVYDSALPPDGVAYPFIYLGDNQLIDDRSIKAAIIGRVHQTIHIWSDNPKKRGSLSKVLLEAKCILNAVKKTENFYWMITSSSQQIVPDNSAKTPLLHAILEVEYRFN